MTKILAPSPPKLPEPTLIEDTDAIERARRKSIAGQKKRSGAASTILTSGGTGDSATLGPS